MHPQDARTVARKCIERIEARCAFKLFLCIKLYPSISENFEF